MAVATWCGAEFSGGTVDFGHATFSGGAVDLRRVRFGQPFAARSVAALLSLSDGALPPGIVTDDSQVPARSATSA
jgi:hypothetical protein